MGTLSDDDVQSKYKLLLQALELLTPRKLPAEPAGLAILQHGQCSHRGSTLIVAAGDAIYAIGTRHAAAPLRVIFLDIDGVICCNSFGRLEDKKLRILQGVCKETAAKVVLSTAMAGISA